MSRAPGAIDRVPRLLCIDKPEGCSSFDVVREVRRVTGARRVGHGGTLDPFATGLLVVAMGPATRLMRFLTAGNKEYVADVVFGTETDSEDRTGVVIRESGCVPSREECSGALEQFVGTIEQVPPRLSAIHVDGERSYRRARRGEEVELEPRRVQVHALEILAFDAPRLTLRVECGGGTYIRSLARDFGRALGSAAHLAELRRTRVAGFSLDQAVPLSGFRTAWESGACGADPAELVAGWPSLELAPDLVGAVRNGIQPRPEWWEHRGWDAEPERLALLDEAGQLVAVATREQEESLRLALVLPGDA